MSVRTGMYHFEVSRTAMYRVRYVLVRTSTYRHVLPCTRCTGFQMGYLFSVPVYNLLEHFLSPPSSVPPSAGQVQSYHFYSPDAEVLEQLFCE
jgi:hypothetical protein